MSVQKRSKVGEVRPSQLMFTFGVGAIVDLPKLSVIVMGLDDWPLNPELVQPIVEDRLLMAVRYRLTNVRRLLSPPIAMDVGAFVNPLESQPQEGVPVATFPRWLVCPQCSLLAPIRSGLFRLKSNAWHPERTVYVHENCNRAKRPPEVVPARFLVACESGHLDDFPWIDYVHEGHACMSPLLRLFEVGASGEASDLYVKCETCQRTRPMSLAFGTANREKLPLCRGRRPHLRDFEDEACGHRIRPILLGASNTWFPTTLSTVAIPIDSGRLAQLVDENWGQLNLVTAPNILDFMRGSGQLGELSEYSNEEVWEAIERRRQQDAGELPAPEGPPDLKAPEWQVFTQFDPNLNSDDFRLEPVDAPPSYDNLISDVVLVERLREVRALVGFTRVDAFGELTDPDQQANDGVAPLSRREVDWVPASEVRGEGIFIRFDEQQLQAWERQPSIERRSIAFLDAHRKWRKARGIEPVDEGFPGMRYILLHTFSHALLRELALECGYSSASLRERLYARVPGHSDGPPMAGVLLYTAAPDSEGTLGGLVRLGRPGELERHIARMLESARLCASDPLCAERPPSEGGRTLHAAACHACTFASETSCERGNKYLDRALLVPTVAHSDLAFFT